MSAPADSDWQQAIRALFANTRIGFLATHGPHGPESSMAPYAIHNGDILLHLSRLARHTTHITAHARAGFMICTPEKGQATPLALPRLSLQGRVECVPAGHLTESRAAYLHAIPEAEPLFGFVDFGLYALHPEHIHWVGGFGSARTLPTATWRRIAVNNARNTPDEQQ